MVPAVLRVWWVGLCVVLPVSVSLPGIASAQWDTRRAARAERSLAEAVRARDPRSLSYAVQVLRENDEAPQDILACLEVFALEASFGATLSELSHVRRAFAHALGSLRPLPEAYERCEATDGAVSDGDDSRAQQVRAILPEFERAAEHAQASQGALNDDEELLREELQRLVLELGVLPAAWERVEVLQASLPPPRAMPPAPPRPSPIPAFVSGALAFGGLVYAGLAGLSVAAAGDPLPLGGSASLGLSLSLILTLPAAWSWANGSPRIVRLGGVLVGLSSVAGALSVGLGDSHWRWFGGGMLAGSAVNLLWLGTAMLRRDDEEAPTLAVSPWALESGAGLSAQGRF